MHSPKDGPRDSPGARGASERAPATEARSPDETRDIANAGGRGPGGERSAPSGVLVFAVSETGSVARLVPRPESAPQSLTVGRGPECDVRIEDPSVSRVHARLEIGARFHVVDLGSRNGTRASGVRIPEGEATEFAAGALVELGSVSVVVQRVGDATQLAELSSPRPASKTERAGDHHVVCEGSVARLLDIVDRVASDKLSVLLLGETGVGKDVFAEMIHSRSGAGRASGPFIRLHCAAFSEQLIESEIFGHERGAFTGAHRAKPGLLEEANGGTVFVDEVGELPMSVQVKLLRVLEDRRVTRIGSVKAARVDVRFVAATNRDLEAEIAKGTFRRDLYYRLAGLVLVVPPLRERRDEILPLARTFLERAAVERGMVAPRLEDDAARALTAHDWPGNVRELKNVVERALLLGRGAPVRAVDLQLDALRLSAPLAPPATASPVSPAPTGAPATEASARTPERDEEVRRILDALAQAGGNQTEAAKIVGVSRRTLINRMIEHGLPRPRKR